MISRLGRAVRFSCGAMLVQVCPRADVQAERSPARLRHPLPRSTPRLLPAGGLDLRQNKSGQLGNISRRKALTCVPAAMLCAVIFKVMQLVCRALGYTKQISSYGKGHFSAVHQEL